MPSLHSSGGNIVPVGGGPVGPVGPAGPAGPANVAVAEDKVGQS